METVETIPKYNRKIIKKNNDTYNTSICHRSLYWLGIRRRLFRVMSMKFNGCKTLTEITRQMINRYSLLEFDVVITRELTVSDKVMSVLYYKSTEWCQYLNCRLKI